jgi:flagellar biosynthesis protein FlhF
LLGVSVYQAKDRSSLALLLAQLQDKKIVLIDTVGVTTQDDKLQDLLHSLELPKLQKIFVTSAATQGDTIDRALRAHGVEKGHPIILTKLDEVERLGPAIDCVVRHGLTIAGLTDGQRVPEDWRSPDPLYLARQALLHPDDDPWQYEEPIAMSRLQSAETHEKWAYV